MKVWIYLMWMAYFLLGIIFLREGKTDSINRGKFCIAISTLMLGINIILDFNLIPLIE